MANERPGPCFRELGVLMGGGTASGLTDRDLLERFLASRDEAAETAFAVLVGRHGPMVRGVCRRMLHDPADVGDAFQATFLVLVRRARSVRVEHSLAPWLHEVSLRVARRARAVAIRRRYRERTNAEYPDLAARAPAGTDDLRAAIDDALGELPARYRSALVLCYLEGLTHEEAAHRLACPVGTVRSRLARGRDLLRSRLVRRGLAPTATASVLAALLAPDPAQAATSACLFAATARAARRLAAGQALAGTVPEGVAVLVVGVSRMLTVKTCGLVACLFVALAAGAAGLAAFAGPPGPHRSEPRQVETPAADPQPPAIALALARAAEEEEQQSQELTGPAVVEGPFDDYPPVVLKTEPQVGALDVDPALTEIKVTFSKDMQNGSWSWVTLQKDRFPETTGRPKYEKDKRTCVLPVKLAPGKTYAISLNSQRFTNFKDPAGHSAIPYLLLFKTRK